MKSDSIVIIPTYNEKENIRRSFEQSLGSKSNLIFL